MDANGFHARLDAYYAAGDVAGAYDYLRAQRDAALQSGDRLLLLTADNALIGHCRENVRFDEVDGYYAEAQECIEALGLHGTHAEATTFLNTATAYCIMGRADRSEALYDAAAAIYSEILQPDDPYMAAVYNNRGLLLRAQGKRGEAYRSFHEAMKVLMRCEDVDAERAATMLNLASVTAIAPQADTLLEAALRYYETPEGQKDIHRFTAMATKAELASRRGDWRAAGDGYAETAAAWERAGLAPQRLRVLLGNAETCYERAGDAAAAAEMRRRKEALAP